SWTVSFWSSSPKRASSSLTLLPYFSCSVSPSTISPPPAATKASIASSSCALSRGEPPPVVRSHFGSDGCAITSTSQPASVPASSGWFAFSRTSNSRSASAAAARAYDASPGCGLHRAGELGPDCPRLAVGFVEQDLHRPSSLTPTPDGCR